MAGINLFTNNSATTLATGINSSVTSLTVASSTGGSFPSPTAGQYFYCTLSNSTGTVIEIVKVTTRVSDTFTIVRAQDNTTAQSFLAGDRVELRLVNASLQNFPQLDSTNTFATTQTFTAAPVFNGGLGTPASGTLTNCTGYTTANLSGSINLTTQVTGTLPIANGGTGQTTATNAFNALNPMTTVGDIIYEGSGPAAARLPIGTTGQVLTVSGGIPSWAALPATGATGATDYTFTSSTNNFTLTSSSNQVVRLLADTTTVSGTPTITLPAMNSGMTAGHSRFVFQNYSALPVALKDSGGTVRQYISSSSQVEHELTIKDISSATGFWYTGSSFQVSAQVNIVQTAVSVLTNAGYFIGGSACIPLTSTTFAVVWVEKNASAYGTGASTAIYAQHFSFNASTNAITASNKVTVQAINSTTSQGYGEILWDTDSAGRALVLVTGVIESNDDGCGGKTFRSGASWFGLSSSGGTLYATTVTVVGLGNTNSNDNYFINRGIYVGYLGSNNAYGFSFTYNTSGLGATTLYFGGCTVTGTTSPTLTNSASNIGVSLGGGSGNNNTLTYSSRTSLTTFTYGNSDTSGSSGHALAGKFVNYVPASNTFTQGNRTTATRLAIEQASLARYSSITWGGFMYNTSNKVIFSTYVWNITNAGAAGVTTTIATTVSAKSYLTPNYSTVNIDPSTGLFPALRSGIIDGNFIKSPNFSIDTTAANFNANGNYTSGGTTSLLSTTSSVQMLTWSTAGYYFVVSGIATPITPV